jgi:hypothetical protein
LYGSSTSWLHVKHFHICLFIKLSIVTCKNWIKVNVVWSINICSICISYMVHSSKKTPTYDVSESINSLHQTKLVHIHHPVSSSFLLYSSCILNISNICIFIFIFIFLKFFLIQSYIGSSNLVNIFNQH